MATNSVSKEAQCKYVIHVFAEYFRRGVYRTLKYELVSQDQSEAKKESLVCYAMIYPKNHPSQLKNLVKILNDKGPSFKPDTLHYMLNGSMDKGSMNYAVLTFTVDSF
jgi:hypothetical protein